MLILYSVQRNVAGSTPLSLLGDLQEEMLLQRLGLWETRKEWDITITMNRKSWGKISTALHKI